MKVSVFKTNQTQSLNIHFLSDLGKVKFVRRLCRFPRFHLEEEAMMISREWFYGFAGVPSIRIFTVYVLKEGLMASKSSSSSQIHLLPRTFWESIPDKKLKPFLGPRGPLVLPSMGPVPSALKIWITYIQAHMPYESSEVSSNQPCTV